MHFFQILRSQHSSLLLPLVGKRKNKIKHQQVVETIYQRIEILISISGHIQKAKEETYFSEKIYYWLKVQVC